MSKRSTVSTNFATYATTSGVSINNSSSSDSGQGSSVKSNTQLMYWRRAKQQYMTTIRNNPNPSLDDRVFIVNNLGHSLLHLFGQNYRGSASGYTPPLLNFVDSSHYNCGYSLESEDSLLFSHLQDLNDYFNDISKHLDQSKHEKALSLTKSKIEEFMETTKRVWIWYGNHCYKNQIPPDQLVEFRDTFCILKKHLHMS